MAKQRGVLTRIAVVTGLISCWALGVGGTVLAADDIYVMKYSESAQGVRQWIGEGWEQGVLPEGHDVRVFARPQYVAEHAPVSEDKIVRLEAASPQALQSYLDQKALNLDMPKDDPLALRDEVVTLVNNGPTANRIDLVFMGDGYTATERGKFFEDIRRLVDQMFAHVTLKSYLPIFNVHAVFRASNESGIGKRGMAKDTAYKLAREGDTLRAIYPGDTAAIRASCRQAPACDYPIVIGNDPYYGGLGGEFAISTSSPESGIVVLRHELGHQIGEVGEEYDGGGYFGANHSSSLQNLSWRHWLSGSLHEEPVVARYIDWPWKNLSQGPFTATFQSDGNQSQYFINLSASGMEGEEDIQFFMDGTRIPIASPGTSDRGFHDIVADHGFSSGQHTIEIREGNRDGNNWVSSLTVHEYGVGFHADPHYVGAYPLFQDVGQKDGYRPVNEGCLMRNMMTEEFCPVCKENNWLKFFGKISMVDGIRTDAEGAGKRVTLVVPALGQFRSDALAGEVVSVKWFKNSQEVPGMAGQLSWLASGTDLSARWEADVTYVTPEVRRDSQGLLHKRVAVTFQ